MSDFDTFRVPRPQWRPPVTGYAPYRWHGVRELREGEIVAPPSGDVMLLESGDDILLESGDRLLLES